VEGFDWRVFLKQWSIELLEDDEIVQQLPADAIAAHWLGYPGATNDQMRAPKFA